MQRCGKHTERARRASYRKREAMGRLPLVLMIAIFGSGCTIKAETPEITAPVSLFDDTELIADAIRNSGFCSSALDGRRVRSFIVAIQSIYCMIEAGFSPDVALCRTCALGLQESSTRVVCTDQAKQVCAQFDATREDTLACIDEARTVQEIYDCTDAPGSSCEQTCADLSSFGENYEDCLTRRCAQEDLSCEDQCVADSAGDFDRIEECIEQMCQPLSCEDQCVDDFAPDWSDILECHRQRC